MVLYLHEGVRFDTQLLKKFRVLQAAKHAFSPFVRSQIVAEPVSNGLPDRRAAVVSRHTSTISLMSGSGSHLSVMPGQCTPVVLFVFDGDFLDSGHGHGHGSMEDASDGLNQAGIVRPGSTLKGSGSVVMLARPMSKTEGGFRKKLHSSLEAQIRFLIKKCRVLAAESGNGSRAVGNMSSFPLFALDASRVVALLDRSVYERGESLDFVTGLVQEALDSKVDLDMSMLESHCQGPNNEDIQPIKDFIYRQSDSLRGRGCLPSNSSSGSVAGVGMVAAAAAAAAASSVAGKPLITTPKLPNLETWLSSSNLILTALYSVKDKLVDEIDKARLTIQRTATEMQDEMISRPGRDAVEAAVSCLEGSKALNMKFSTSWCQRALPAAKDVYLKELPACYPTALHNVQLEKAMNAFHSMVKGPAVQLFAKKLEDECISIWESGRQLCDAVSLTGKPCMHLRHSVMEGDSPSGTVVKQHSSGYFFLHACACGRSRRLREDPFDFGSANVEFNNFPNCEDLLPTLILPGGSSAGSIPPSSWKLVRLGGARYYKPSKGLLQVGFCPTEIFLLKWTIYFGIQKGTYGLSLTDAKKCNGNNSSTDSTTVTIVDEPLKKSDAPPIPTVQSVGPENQRKPSEVASVNGKGISFGRGLPTFTMKKAFSEVVAGTVVADSTFPVLQQRKQTKAAPGKGTRKAVASDQSDVQSQLADDRQGSQKTEQVFSQESSQKHGANCHSVGDSYLHIGSNAVPVNMIPGGKAKPNISSKEVTVYVGFEYECSYGHRFLLSQEHLKVLHSSYLTSDYSNSAGEDSELKSLGAKNALHEKVVPYLSETKNTTVGIMKNSSRQSEKKATDTPPQNRRRGSPRPGMEKFHLFHGSWAPSESVEELEKLSHVKLDDGGSAFSLLNRNLPVYMNCPHCRSSAKQDHHKIKFASTISQLQRIFLVTPAFPIVLSTCPLIQFEGSCLPASIQDRGHQLSFSLGCPVILPPESFLTLRLPFVYGVQIDDGSLHPINHLEQQPELTACLVGGTTLLVVSVGPEMNE